MLLKNRVAIITGGVRGIGKGIALKFAEEGCSVVVTDIIDAGETIKEISDKGADASFIQCDVTRADEVAALVSRTIERYGKVDILVNNAGIGPQPRFFCEVPEDEWDRVLAVNLKAAFLCCKAVVPHMQERKYGKIVNISSLVAVMPLMPNVHYTASKAGLMGLTADLALQLAPFNICVNAILPGLVATPLWDSVIPSGTPKEAFFDGVARAMAIPMQRAGTPEDMARVALFYASYLSDYVTGDRVIAGGGSPLWTIGKPG
jgi:NAD(P)-dependent dehydrogenase (short-subunit alcohol dehydrogenase family)